MLRSLKEVQVDDSVVGFYQATTLGAFFNQTLLDTQAIHQDKLRHGGIVIVHGASQNSLRLSTSFHLLVIQTCRKLQGEMLPLERSA
jgi:translation initiation factor 3 subunit H